MSDADILRLSPSSGPAVQLHTATAPQQCLYVHLTEALRPQLVTWRGGGGGGGGGEREREGGKERCIMREKYDVHVHVQCTCVPYFATKYL